MKTSSSNGAGAAGLSGLAGAWELFARLSFGGAGVSPEQSGAMRQAFYAGGWFVLSSMIAAGELDDDLASGVLEGLRAECLRFAEDVRGGRI